MKTIHPPFFEIGPKSYLYGDQILQLALAADAASQKYGVDVIFINPPFCERDQWGYETRGALSLITID